MEIFHGKIENFERNPVGTSYPNIGVAFSPTCLAHVFQITAQINGSISWKDVGRP